jgi:EAL domain-containing protein (putative c-di-GMP-specific phosphodiesterase class I)
MLGRPGRKAPGKPINFPDDDDMKHDCKCAQGKRQLRLGLAAGETIPQLLDAAAGRFGWQVDEENAELLLTVGGDSRFRTVAELAVYMREIVPESFSQMTFSWVDTPAADVALSRELAGVEANPLYDLLEQRRLETWFQPVFTGELSLWGYECLVRGRDADGGLVTPDRLIAWAREDDLLFYFDRVCRETHVHNAARADVPGDARFLLNFLPTTIYEPAVCLRTTFKAINEVGLDHGRIIFEVVETERVEDAAKLRQILDFYRASGFGVALDDLGTGHSGLLLLAELEPDLIKLDRELVGRVDSTRIHRSICQSVIDLGKEEGKLVLAEGVETAAQFEVLKAMGADLFQGFYLGRPSPKPATLPQIES